MRPICLIITFTNINNYNRTYIRLRTYIFFTTQIVQINIKFYDIFILILKNSTLYGDKSIHYAYHDSLAKMRIAKNTNSTLKHNWYESLQQNGLKRWNEWWRISEVNHQIQIICFNGALFKIKAGTIDRLDAMYYTYYTDFQ